MTACVELNRRIVIAALFHADVRRLTFSDTLAMPLGILPNFIELIARLTDLEVIESVPKVSKAFETVHWCKFNNSQ